MNCGHSCECSVELLISLFLFISLELYHIAWFLFLSQCIYSGIVWPWMSLFKPSDGFPDCVLYKINTTVIRGRFNLSINDVVSLCWWADVLSPPLLMKARVQDCPHRSRSSVSCLWHKAYAIQIYVLKSLILLLRGEQYKVK